MYIFMKTPCGVHTAAPVILAWLYLCGFGGLCLACPCGRFVCCQGLGRAWQVLGIMSGAVESNNKYFKISVYPHFKIVPKCMQRLENEAQDDKKVTQINQQSLIMRPWVFWDALGTPGGSRTMKKEHRVLRSFALWAALGAPRADFGTQGVSQNHPKSS